jgi:dsDNA-specific endonuclease/ATPase MutS2
MAGKSTVLQTLGQVFYLSAFAIPLPCQKAHLPLVDFVFFSSDTESSIRTDLSSFASELIAINTAVKQPGIGLFLIDEFARGTNPQEGESFARAILEFFIDRKGIVVSATHFTTPSYIIQAAHYRIIGLTKNDYEKLKNTLSPYDPTKKMI